MSRRHPLIDVACFGEILWDIFELAPQRHEALGHDLRRELGGAPANVATGLARLGVRASVVGGVGRDRFGDALVQHLRTDGVDTHSVVRLSNRTGLTFVARDARGEPAFLFYRHETADVSMTRADITAEMGRARWALLGTSTLMTPRLAGATGVFLRAAERAGALIVVDLNVRAHLWPSRARMRESIARLVRHASMVKASSADLEALGTRGSRGTGWLQAHAPKASWLVTRGAGQASAFGEHGAVHAPARRARCVDATGGGDAFLAGALAVLIAARASPGKPPWRDPRVWRAALEVGHSMAGKAISAPGAVKGLVGLAAERARLETIREGS
jgi:fructokinase